jgi:hypothetical protein
MTGAANQLKLAFTPLAPEGKPFGEEAICRKASSIRQIGELVKTPDGEILIRPCQANR